MIYDFYIDNDDKHIKSSIRRLIPIYARRLRIIKTKYMFHWKKYNRKRLDCNLHIHHVNSSIVSKRLYEDYKYRWYQLRDLEMKYQSIEAQDCTFSPRINHYYRPQLRQSKSYSKVDLIKIEEPPMKKRRRSVNNSMTDIFNNIKLIENYKGYIPDRSIVHLPTYRIPCEIKPVKKQMKTINGSSSSNRDKDSIKTLIMSDSLNHMTKFNPPSNKNDQSKIKLLKGSNESTEEDTRKGLKSKDKRRPYQIGFKEFCYLADNNNSHHHQNRDLGRNESGNHITLQTLSDSKVLQLATHYITTDESFERFKWNMIK